MGNVSIKNPLDVLLLPVTLFTDLTTETSSGPKYDEYESPLHQFDNLSNPYTQPTQTQTSTSTSTTQSTMIANVPDYYIYIAGGALVLVLLIK